jgi:hypothetical protein
MGNGLQLGCRLLRETDNPQHQQQHPPLGQPMAQRRRPRLAAAENAMRVERLGHRQEYRRAQMGALPDRVEEPDRASPGFGDANDHAGDQRRPPEVIEPGAEQGVPKPSPVSERLAMPRYPFLTSSGR